MKQWDPESYARSAHFVPELGRPLLTLLEPRRGERMLDLGCGDGVLTQELAAGGCEVVGVDSSPEMVCAARKRGIDARVMDGESLSFASEFDGVLSNAALHWMRHPDAVIEGVWRALRPGGRFVGELGGAGNIELVYSTFARILADQGVPPESVEAFYFPSVAEYRDRLEAREFEVISAEALDRPTPIPKHETEWLAMVAAPFLHACPEGRRDSLLARAYEALDPLLRRAGTWVADYVRLRFSARKPT